MIFISQGGITDASRAAAWDAWYVEHLKIMLTVPGVSSAQRFMTDIAGYSPSLAMYTMTGPEVFDDPYYRSVRGMGEWLSLIDQRYYRRNLFAGLDRAPAVAADQRLIVADRDRQDPTLADLTMTWLNSVAADRSTPMRGIAVLDATVALKLHGREIAVYRPVTDHRVSAPKAGT